jgi:hypothetical protein
MAMARSSRRDDVKESRVTMGQAAPRLRSVPCRLWERFLVEGDQGDLVEVVGPGDEPGGLHVDRYVGRTGSWHGRRLRSGCD